VSHAVTVKSEKSSKVIHVVITVSAVLSQSVISSKSKSTIGDVSPSSYIAIFVIGVDALHDKTLRESVHVITNANHVNLTSSEGDLTLKNNTSCSVHISIVFAEGVVALLTVTFPHLTVVL
jgi:hypothetical protein